jgi:hypothetical protein
MSANGKRVCRPQHYGPRKDAEPQPGDEAVGAFSPEQLVRFDNRFTERLLRAFETGRESREAAGATHGASPARPR